MDSKDPFLILSRSIYALFDGPYFTNKVLKQSVVTTFVDGLAEIITISVDTEANIHAQLFNPVLDRIRSGDTQAVDTLRAKIQEHMKSQDMNVLFAEYYAQMIPVIISALEEGKKEVARELLLKIGVTDELIQQTHEEYNQMLRMKKAHTLSRQTVQ